MKKNIPSKKMKVALTIGAAFILIFILGIYRYLSFSIPADEEALVSLFSTKQVEVIETDTTIAFKPLDQIPTTALIYYPGGQVAPESFAYAANQIAQEGYLVIIQKMPFELAFFGVDKAFDIVHSYAEIEQWYLSGFSLGGVAASVALSKDASLFDGLILYASYTTKNYDLSTTSLRVLSLSGSNDALATPEKIQNAKVFLPQETTFIEIEGGNHTQFAIYGNRQLQKGDGKANITRMEQQKIIIEETLAFLGKNKN
jgi:dienelactone hydrolase